MQRRGRQRRWRECASDSWTVGRAPGAAGGAASSRTLPARTTARRGPPLGRGCAGSGRPEAGARLAPGEVAAAAGGSRPFVSHGTNGTVQTSAPPLPLPPLKARPGAAARPPASAASGSPRPRARSAVRSGGAARLRPLRFQPVSPSAFQPRAPPVPWPYSRPAAGAAPWRAPRGGCRLGSWVVPAGCKPERGGTLGAARSPAVHAWASRAVSAACIVAAARPAEVLAPECAGMCVCPGRGAGTPACVCLSAPRRTQEPVTRAGLCLEQERPAAPLSVPETLTCDVYRSDPRVRLLGAGSRAFASRRLGGTFSFKAKTKEKKVCPSDWCAAEVSIVGGIR